MSWDGILGVAVVVLLSLAHRWFSHHLIHGKYNYWDFERRLEEEKRKRGES